FFFFFFFLFSLFLFIGGAGGRACLPAYLPIHLTYLPTKQLTNRVVPVVWTYGRTFVTCHLTRASQRASERASEQAKSRGLLFFFFPFFFFLAGGCSFSFQISLRP
ncbi:hypothetical protein IWX91DRAFT_339969, partial [Phyllosticta citricarpa]